MAHISIPLEDMPIEILEITPVNPLISKCQIKVCYVGQEPNRNMSVITKEVATELAASIPGCPIVGLYNEEKGDFEEHNRIIEVSSGKFKIKDATRPYGFVSMDAKVWFQWFEDDGVKHEYLCTERYIWTGQYPESQRVITKGNNQSMELDEENLNAFWTKDNNGKPQFFIINEAIMSKLCILGEDVEPCFEGASVTAPQVSKSFSKVDDNFKQTLYTMMQDLRYALEEGGKNMELEEKEVETVEEEVKTEEETVEAEETESSIETETTSTEAEVENESEEEPTEEETTESENESSEEEPESETEEAEGDAPSDYSDNEEEESEEEEPLDNSDDVETKKKEYSAEEYELLKSNYDELETKYNELVEFKKNVELEKKQELINSFYMLSDEDKKDVKEHMSEYSLEEIESKLCVICVKNKVNFEKDNLDENNNKVEEENSAVATFNIDNNESSEIPAWISACIKTQNSKN